MTENHGVLLGVKSTDWIAGIDSQIKYEVRNESGDWTPYLVKKEYQKFDSFDTMACVAFAHNNLCEIQIKHQTNQELNFSDRFLAKMSGTTPAGNWLYIVSDTLRKYGAVLEEEWPTPPDPSWNTYYSEIPQFVKDRAKSQFLDKYQIQTEYIPIEESEIQKHLKHAPLGFVIPGHMVSGILLKADSDKVVYFDTYNKFIKETYIDNLQNVYKVLLTTKQMTKYRIQTGSKLGVYIDYGFNGIAYYAKDEAMYQRLLQDYEVPFNAPLIVTP